MNWYCLYDILAEIDTVEEIVMAHPYKTRLIAEAQVKIDARMLAGLLLGNLVCRSNACGPEARRRVRPPPRRPGNDERD